MKNNIFNKLKYWLKSTDQILRDFESFVLDKNDPSKHRIFIDRKSSVLFVAHIDTVQKPKFIRNRKTKSGKLKRIYAQGLDDRLGCLLVCELSKELNADLLICDHEESAKSTGQYHNLKDYNWIAEFDRAGNDVVTYDLDCDGFRQALSDYWKIGFGAFSDILQLKTQACCVNIGIGYEFAHSKDSYVCIKTTFSQITKFKKFFNKYKNTKFVQDYSYTNWQNDYYDRTSYFDRFNQITKTKGTCEICNLSGDCDYVHGHIVCYDCFEDMLQYYCYNLREFFVEEEK